MNSEDLTLLRQHLQLALHAIDAKTVNKSDEIREPKTTEEFQLLEEQLLKALTTVREKMKEAGK